MRNQRTAEERKESALRAAQTRKEHEAEMTPLQRKKLKEWRRANGLRGFQIKMEKRNAAKSAQLDWVNVATKQLTTGQKAAQTRKANYEKLTPAQRAAKTRKFRASYRKTVAERKAFVEKGGNGSLPKVTVKKNTVHDAIALIESNIRKSVIQEMIVMLQKMEKEC